MIRPIRGCVIRHPFDFIDMQVGGGGLVATRVFNSVRPERTVRKLGVLVGSDSTNIIKPDENWPRWFGFDAKKNGML